MKIQTEKLDNAALDWAFLLAKGLTQNVDLNQTYAGADGRKYICLQGGFTVNYLDWSQGGKILEELMLQGMLLEAVDPSYRLSGMLPFKATLTKWGTVYRAESMLLAALRCHIASILGDEVEVPDSLV